jgi:hypothetical protein
MATPSKSDPKQLPLSSDEVRRLAGSVADHTVIAILETGATIADLEVAVIYARGEGNYVDRAGHPLSGKAAQISDILAKDELYAPSNER